MARDVVLSRVGIGVDGVKGIGHPFEYFFQTNHLAKETLDVSVHDVFLAGGNGVRTVLERRWLLSVRCHADPWALLT
jgi:hypothetical protein